MEGRQGWAIFECRLTGFWPPERIIAVRHSARGEERRELAPAARCDGPPARSALPKPIPGALLIAAQPEKHHLHTGPGRTHAGPQVPALHQAGMRSSGGMGTEGVGRLGAREERMGGRRGVNPRLVNRNLAPGVGRWQRWRLGKQWRRASPEEIRGPGLMRYYPGVAESWGRGGSSGKDSERQPSGKCEAAAVAATTVALKKQQPPATAFSLANPTSTAHPKSQSPPTSSDPSSSPSHPPRFPHSPSSVPIHFHSQAPHPFLAILVPTRED